MMVDVRYITILMLVRMIASYTTARSNEWWRAPFSRPRICLVCSYPSNGSFHAVPARARNRTSPEVHSLGWREFQIRHFGLTTWLMMLCAGGESEHGTAWTQDHVLPSSIGACGW